MLIVHHLEKSQSERIVWLCEELGIPYELKIHQRDPVTFASPPELQALHPSKAAPVIQDGKVTLAESGAIVEYILAKYGQGKLSIPPSADNYADYLYFLHFSNSSLQAALGRYHIVIQAELSPDLPSVRFAKRSRDSAFDILENRLSNNTWLAGDEFTAADIMIVFSLTTMRRYFPYSLEEYPATVAFLKRVSEREGYQRAMSKGDPGFTPLIGAGKPERVGAKK